MKKAINEAKKTLLKTLGDKEKAISLIRECIEFEKKSNLTADKKEFVLTFWDNVIEHIGKLDYKTVYAEHESELKKEEKIGDKKCKWCKKSLKNIHGNALFCNKHHYKMFTFPNYRTKHQNTFKMRKQSRMLNKQIQEIKKYGENKRRMSLSEYVSTHNLPLPIENKKQPNFSLMSLLIFITTFVFFYFFLSLVINEFDIRNWDLLTRSLITMLTFTFGFTFSYINYKLHKTKK
jgi:hypothetical protein